MRPVLFAKQMKAADAAAVSMGLPSCVLMERAALAMADEITRAGYDLSRVCVLCGPGNNGGDGAALARILAERGYEPVIVIPGNGKKFTKELEDQLKTAKHYGIVIRESFENRGYTLMIDALFGIGLSRDLDGEYAKIIDEVNKSGIPVVSADIPSGINADTANICGTAIKAELTVTFAALKPGHLLYPGKGYCGRTVCKQIGIPVTEREALIRVIEGSDTKILKKRDEQGNKGTFGKVLVIAGSKGICGAAHLASAAALRAGCGMVKTFTHRDNRTALCTLLPEAMISVYGDEGVCGGQLASDLEWADTVVIGPGIGTDETARKLLETFFSINTLPAVIDADALNIISGDMKLLEQAEFPVTVTPHVGEMSRLTGLSASEIKAGPMKAASEFALRYGVTCVLKDAVTVTAEKNGNIFINTAGTSALAKAGTGDVLAGLIGSFKARLRGEDVCAEALAVYIHALAGKAALKHSGVNYVTASDVIKEFSILL